MPRYFFNVHDGVSIPDDTGTDLSGIKEAHTEAVKMSSVLLSEHSEKFWNGEGWSIDVANKAGEVLFTLAFTASVKLPIEG